MSYEKVKSGLKKLENSARKQEILDKLVLGYKNLEIANELGIKPSTVRHCITEIYEAFDIEKNQNRRRHLESIKQLTNLIITYAPDRIINLGWDSISSNLKEQLYAKHPLPKGIVPIDSPFYLKRSADNWLENRFGNQSHYQPKKIIIIKGSKGVGKSSLLNRLYYLLKSQTFLVKLIDLNYISELNNDQSLNNPEIFLQEFIHFVIKEFGKKNNSSTQPFFKYWKEQRENYVDMGSVCTNYLNDYIFSNLKTPSYLLIDGIDITFAKSVQSHLENLFRSWSQHKIGNPQLPGTWPNIIITYSTSSCVISKIGSPLVNAGDDLPLKEFNEEEVSRLSNQYGLNLSDSEIPKLMKLLGGKPEAIQIAFYHISKDKISVDDLLINADKLDGIFQEYLRHLAPLEKMSQLIEPFKKILNGEGPIHLEIQFQLEKAGLIKIKDNSPVPACLLFEKYYKKYLEALSE